MQTVRIDSCAAINQLVVTCGRKLQDYALAPSALSTAFAGPEIMSRSRRPLKRMRLLSRLLNRNRLELRLATFRPCASFLLPVALGVGLDLIEPITSHAKHVLRVIPASAHDGCGSDAVRPDGHVHVFSLLLG